MDFTCENIDYSSFRGLQNSSTHTCDSHCHAKRAPHAKRTLRSSELQLTFVSCQSEHTSTNPLMGSNAHTQHGNKGMHEARCIHSNQPQNKFNFSPSFQLREADGDIRE